MNKEYDHQQGKLVRKKDIAFSMNSGKQHTLNLEWEAQKLTWVEN